MPSPCEGANSEFFPAGVTNQVNKTKHKTCRPQLHAAGIGTWLNPLFCEDPALKADVTEETVYTAITQLGAIFNVPYVAEQLISEIRNDFSIAEQTLQASGRTLNAVWFDGLCDDPEQMFVGAGLGAHNLIMQKSGLTNMFGGLDKGWACVSVSEVRAANPDVIIIVEFAWDSALGKIDAASGNVVGLGHLKSYGSQELRGFKSYGYHHFFFARLSRPPFNIIHRSSLFRFPYVLLNHGATTSWQSAESDFSVQFALSLRHDDSGESGNDLMVYIGAGDLLGLTARISGHAFCNFTGWCTAGLEHRRGFGGLVYPVPTDPTAGPGCG